jgi:ribulose bisphosphate carboxylase small subunit
MLSPKLQDSCLSQYWKIGEKYAQAPKSRKQAYWQLREETGLPKWVLKKAI